MLDRVDGVLDGSTGQEEREVSNLREKNWRSCGQGRFS